MEGCVATGAAPPVAGREPAISLVSFAQSIGFTANDAAATCDSGFPITVFGIGIGVKFFLHAGTTGGNGGFGNGFVASQFACGLTQPHAPVFGLQQYFTSPVSSGAFIKTLQVFAASVHVLVGLSPSAVTSIVSVSPPTHCSSTELTVPLSANEEDSGALAAVCARSADFGIGGWTNVEGLEYVRASRYKMTQGIATSARIANPLPIIRA